MPLLARWLLQNSSTYESICSFLIPTLIVFCFLALGEQTAAGANSRTLGFFRHPATFISVMALCLVLRRLSLFYISSYLNTDEAQALASAIKFQVDWVPWRSVDNGTVGPFMSWLLNVFNLMGLPLDCHTARTAGLICLITQWTFVYLSLRLVTTEALSRLFTCAGVVFSVYSSHPDWLHYSSEHLPNAVLAGAWYYGIRWMVGGKLRYAWISMLLLGWLPWIKIQYAPFTVLFAPVLMAGLIYTNPKQLIKNAGYSLLALAAPTIVMSIILLTTGSFSDFFRSYILSNIAYTAMPEGAAPPAGSITPPLILGWLIIPPSRAFSYPLFALVLTGITILLVRPQLISSRAKIFFLLFLTGMAASVLSVSVSGRDYLHYLLIAVLVQTIVTGLFCGEIIQKFLHGLTVKRRTLAEGAFCIAIGFITIWPQHLARNNRTPFPYPYPWAEQIQAAHQSARKDSKLTEKYGHKPMAIWGYRPDIFVALAAVPATRDISTYRAIFPGRLRTYYQNRFLSDLKQSKPPTFIDATPPDLFGFTDPKHEAHEIFEALKTYIADNYVLEKAGASPGLMNGVRIYRLKSLLSPGEADAQSNSQDYKKAVKWFLLAADQGNVEAQFYLGAAYYEGKSVPQDFKEAVKWFHLAAEQGNALAQYNLGVAYAAGKGVPQDFKEAVRWYRLAADQGNVEAQFCLGVAYATGIGVPQDDKEAVKWYHLSAEQGNASAQYNLGVAYATGTGVSKDRPQAYAWWNIAAEQGYEKAKEFRALILKTMTLTQIEEGLSLSRKYAEKFVKK